MKPGNRQIAALLALAVTLCLSPSQAELIAHYKFDESAGGLANDSSGGNHAAWVPAVQSAPGWEPAGGILGGAVRFPGSGTHVNYFSIASLPEINGTPAGMTIATWFKPGGSSGYRGIVMSREVVGSSPFGFGHDGDHLDGRVEGAAIDSPDGTLTAIGEWFHIAWVWDNHANTQQLYINGAPAASPRGVAAQMIQDNRDWRIGDDACCSDRNLDGLLDDLAIYDHALTVPEISDLYLKGLEGYSADQDPAPPETIPLNVGLVINEIYHDADPKPQPLEFIELLNTGPHPVDLSGYHFDGIDFVFPPDTELGVAEYAVVGEDPATTFRYRGALAGDGEEITLRDAAGVIVDRVDYRAEFPWPIVDGGESMQLINATLDNDLGGSWRPAPPSPGFQNRTFRENAAPQLRQVSHSPQQPTSAEAITVRVKATDPDGIGSLTLQYQTNAPGAFVPAFLPLPSNLLRGAPNTPLSPNPPFEQGWVSVPMSADASGENFSGLIPAQPHRTLIRYRISASDTLGNTIRAPFPDDPSLNFATFSYDGVPDYLEHPAEILTSLPVYHLITDADALAQCWAYDSGDQVGSIASRKLFNWEGAMVYEGVVYDHIGYRLRQRNDRYAGQGRRSMRFRFRKGHYLQARDPSGEPYAAKWRSMNTSKMSRFAEPANHGMRELVSSRLWNLAGAVAPQFQHVHFRVIDDSDEQADQYHGDFYGLAMIFEDVDAQFLENRALPRGNIYKLRDGETDPLDLQNYQARDAVSDGSDFVNIRDNLGPPARSDEWLRDHVDWKSWYLYAALGEGFRHYDFSPYWKKNRIWYFRPEPGTPFGLMSIIPHDTDATWKRGTNDTQWNDPTWGPSPGFRGRVVGVDLPKEAIQEIDGLDGTDGENHPERDAFMLEYRNVIREVRDLLWQPETVNTIIDQAYENIAGFSPADRARWSGGPADAGRETIGPLEDQVALMKSLAFTEDLYMGKSLQGGRAQWLSDLAADPDIPNTPTISRSEDGVLSSSAFTDPQGARTFAGVQWRIAEVQPASAAGGSLISAGDTWHYFDLGLDPGSSWAQPSFDDSAWAVGPTKMGYGDEGEVTQLTPGSTAKYFRKSIIVDDPSSLSALYAGIVRDDGAVVYVNGSEVWRSQMPEGEVSPATLANSPASGSNERDFQEFTVSAERFLPGENLIAVEVHQINAASDDMGFNFRLEAAPAPAEPKYEWHATWVADGAESTVAPPAAATRPGRSYRARVRHLDTTGRWSHWSEPVEFVASQPDISAYLDSLVISEIMYHPSEPTPDERAAGFTDGDDFEFIEIRNVGTRTLELGDVRLTKGVDFDLSGSIEPGGYVLVVNNLAAFDMRYGQGLNVVGEWSGRLDNGGERVKLSFGAGIPIRDFVYDDTAPWPTRPDGEGSSLVLIDPVSLPDHSNPFSWRPGPVTPGSTDTTAFAGGDLLAYATRGTPRVAVATDGSIAVSYEINQLAEDLIVRLETSTDLLRWQPAAARILASEPSGDGYSKTTFELDAPGDTRTFVRLAVALR